MSGYDARPHKRERKGLRFAVVVLLIALAGAAYLSTAASAQVAETQGVITIENIKKPLTGNECYYALVEGQHLSDVGLYKLAEGQTVYVLHDIYVYVVTWVRNGNRELNFRCSHKFPLKTETRNYR